jgi:outer membrane receptor protein involved in Fe transport
MRFFLLALLFFSSVQIFAQYPGGGRTGGGQRGMGGNMNVGHFYGKVVDSKTNRGIDGASVQILINQRDTTGTNAARPASMGTSTGMADSASNRWQSQRNQLGSNRTVTDSNHANIPSAITAPRDSSSADTTSTNTNPAKVAEATTIFKDTASANTTRTDTTSANATSVNASQPDSTRSVAATIDTTRTDTTRTNITSANALRTDTTNSNASSANTTRTGRTAQRTTSQKVVKTVITQGNGDFDLENLPVMGQLTLRVSAIGFKTYEKPVSFNIHRPAGGATGGMDMMGMVDKDLGNIKLEVESANLGNVTVTTTKQLFEMGIDRKIFNVDRNLTSTGQTATEVMKSIPSLSVDIDGNVTMRNSTPQLFVDGRPTTLTMDQIPADIIDRVELITNPSAKFDASGGNAGILNIVLKKNRKTGYNGSIRTGVDSRGAVNAGVDINLRQNKVNFFGSGNFNQRISRSTSTTDRTYLNAPLKILQSSRPYNNGSFAFARGGMDYFIDIRNTVSLALNYNKGSFKNEDQQRVDSIKTDPTYNMVSNNSNFKFENLGSQLSYKHNFAKNGHDLSADVNYNSSKNNNTTFLNTNTFSSATSNPKYSPVSQQSLGLGNSKNLIVQTDYENPVSDNTKFEAGLRASIRDVVNESNQYFSTNSGPYVFNPRISSNYKYTDKVYAAYATYSLKVNKWSYQFGLRAESSFYTGTMRKNNVSLLNDSSFSIKYPLSLFPSIFTTYKLSEKEDIQLNYSRRINRPNFFQLLPFYDYSDPQNVSIGNAGLKPEFTNSFEVSYNNSYKKGANFLVSTFFKYNTNLITRFQYYGVNPDATKVYSNSDSIPINTYINANNSITYGIELTNRMPVTQWWDMTLNVNLFNSTINVTDPTGKTADYKNQRTSWFAKWNNTVKIVKTLSLQLSGEYFARTVLPSEGGRGGGSRGGGGGGPMFGGGFVGTAQGYINPRYAFDAGLRKDFTWKGGNTASLTLSMNDIFRTQYYSTYSESSILIQNSKRQRDPQVVRLNFNWRFGKFDPNLFKRKSNRTGEDTNDMIPQ